jgi:hypothetical protein
MFDVTTIEFIYLDAHGVSKEGGRSTMWSIDDVELKQE